MNKLEEELKALYLLIVESNTLIDSIFSLFFFNFPFFFFLEFRKQ